MRVGLVSERESIKLLPPHVLHLPCRNDMDATRVLRLRAAPAWTGVHARIHRQGKPPLPSGDPAPRVKQGRIARRRQPASWPAPGLGS